MWPHSSYRHALRPVVWVILSLILIQLAAIFLIPTDLTAGIAGYVPLHTALETFAIVISMVVFAIGWSSYGQERSISLAFLACVFLGIGLIDFMHVLSYQGMPDFVTPNSPDKTLKFWLAARLLNALGLLALVLIPWSRQTSPGLRWWFMAIVLVIVAVVTWEGIFSHDWIPALFITEQGLTTFKLMVEYCLVGLFIVIAFSLLYKMRTPQPYDAVSLFAAACIMAMSEMFFTWYADFTDLFNFLGHVYKVIAYGFIYNSIFVSSIRKPYQRLSESKNLLQTVVDTIPMRIFWKDDESRFLGCNTAFSRDMGADSPLEIKGRQEAELLPAKQAEAYRLDDMAIMQKETPRTALQKVHSQSDERWLHTSKIPLRDTRHQIMGVLGIYDDVTEQVRTNQKLYMYQSLIEYSAEPIGILDPQQGFRIVLANNAACEHFGVAMETLLATHVSDWDTNYSRKRLGYFWRSLKSRKHILLQSVHRKASGETVPVEISASYLRHDEQELVAVYFRDISQRRKSEESMQLAALVYQSSSEAMAVTDPIGNILDINPAFTEVTGYARHEVLGKNANILSSGRHDTAFYDAMWHSIDATGSWQGEIWNRRKNGEIYAEWLTINTIYDKHGEPYRRVELFSDITRRKEAEALIWRQANFDILTGLPNRNMFHDRLEHEIKQSQRTGQRLALMFLDLDHFKDINDTLGHSMGDLLLKEAAIRVTGCVRETDSVARLGGDEFTVILAGLDDLTSIERISQCILQKLAEPFQLGENPVYVTVSIGLTFYPDDASTLEELLKNADQAMYAAKSEGRNRYNYFTASMQEAAQKRMHMVMDLRTALREQQFQLHYQPIIELQTGLIHKAEALIRWMHPVHGLINPMQFIPIAEKTGMINEIGDWVFEEAARQTARWRAEFRPDFQVSINKSPVQFQHGGTTPDHWRDFLQALGLPGESVVVEITEGLLLDASPAISNQLLELREAGIEVAIDDFGTGYSSLAYLKRFDIDYVKIDRTFVCNMASSPNDVALCDAIIVMAHKLGMKVIAEGVETHEQRQLLLAAGCDFAQGFLFAPALTAAKLEALLKASAKSV